MQAAETCRDIFAWTAQELGIPDVPGLKVHSHQPLSKETRDAKYTELLLGDGDKKPDLKLTWRVNSPENIKNIDDQNWILVAHKKETLEHIINPWNKEQLYTKMNRFLGMPHPDLRFFDNLYRNYTDRIRTDIINKIKTVEENLPAARQSYALLTDTNTGETLGTMRVFDGTPKRAFDLLEPGRAESSPVLPFEAIFNIRNIPVKFIEKIRQMRIDDPYRPIMEIGKLSLTGPPAVRDRGMKSFELFLLDYFCTRYPDAIFVVHVETEAHLALYQKRYGFEITEKVKIPGMDHHEYILTLTADKFAEALKQRLGL